MYDEKDGHDFTHHTDDDTNVPLPSVAAPEPDHDTDTQALDLETGLTDSLGEIKDAQCESSSSSSIPIRVVSRKRLRQVSSSDEEDPYTTKYCEKSQVTKVSLSCFSVSSHYPCRLTKLVFVPRKLLYIYFFDMFSLYLCISVPSSRFTLERDFIMLYICCLINILCKYWYYWFY
ncbi:hypothetical protein DPMN_129614 [Dreissena polymorpha]|uniref:Uncharacterized protein n=1 Tax=Dreissena polymorpha TaxID=45954 RepID=A0A9D4JYF1_DREPO|nr:hypothetical protein DPMN_129614 [Dreissena polymorpha]